MGKTVLFVGVSLAFALPALPGLAYSTNVGSVSWRNQGGYVYDSTGVLWAGDDFDGPAGSALTSPPYDGFVYPPITRNGDGTIGLIGKDEETRVEVRLPNFDSDGNWLTARNADFVVNFQTGTPPLGYGFSVEIDTEGFEPAEDDSVMLGVYTFPFPDGVQCGLVFFDDDTEGLNPLTFMSLSDLGIEGFSSLGLRLSVDSDGICTPYYWPNPDDGILGFDDLNWLQLGSATSQLDMSKLHDDISFQIINGEVTGDFCGENFGPADGYVDVWDLMQFADHWHTSPGDNWDPKFDLAGPNFGPPDGYIDVWDLMVFADHWHEGVKP